MGRKKAKTLGPDIQDGVRYEVIPANKRALSKLQGSLSEKTNLVKTMKMLSPEQFTGRADGERYLRRNADKWSGEFCPFVVIRDIDSLSSPKIKDLRKKIEDKEKGLADTISKTDVSCFKAKLVTCEKCESRINRNYIRDSLCPVCSNDMRSKSANQSIASKRAKIQRYKDRLYEECVKNASDAPLKYLVVVPEIGVEND